MNYLLEIGLVLRGSWEITLGLFLVLILFLFIVITRLRTCFHFWKQSDNRLMSVLKKTKNAPRSVVFFTQKGWMNESDFAKVYRLSGFAQKLEIYMLLWLFLALVLALSIFKNTNFLWAIVGFTVVFVFGILLVHLKARDQRKKLVVQIPIFLRALGNAMQAGYTLEQSFSFIAEEMDDPLKMEVVRLNQNLQLQIPLEKALQDFADIIENGEVDFFVESTLIQLKTGGNLVQLFQRIAYMIDEKLKLQRDIKSFTSQGKLSGILIAVLWPLSLAAFSWISPQHTAVLFETPAGQALLGISILLELIGFFFIWKIITIKI